VDNSFGILKKNFKELFLKTNLHILFLPYVVLYCCIFYNIILDGKNLDMEALKVQLDMDFFFSYVHQIDLGQGQRPTTYDLGERKKTTTKDNDIEVELEDKTILGTNQMLILEQYLGNRPRQMH